MSRRFGNIRFILIILLTVPFWNILLYQFYKKMISKPESTKELFQYQSVAELLFGGNSKIRNGVVAHHLTGGSTTTRPYSLSDRFLTIHPLDGSEGRLGNFCFRYAAALGIAKRNRMILVLPDNGFVRDMKRTFNLSAASASDIPFWNVLTFTKVTEAHWAVYDSEYNSLPPGHTQLTLMYTQSWKYFYEIPDKVRQELKLNDLISQPARNYVMDLRRRLAVTQVVGMHVRRGDFLVKEFADWGYSVATPEFFSAATSWFIKKYGLNILFLVASDDIPWCKENINFNGATHVYSLNSSSMEDFSRLIACDHHVVSVGSFGWWTAWLGGGDVVYYKDFPTPNSNHSSNHRAEDYYPPHWVPL